MTTLPPLLDALIKGSVLIGLAAVLARILRGQPASARHAVWTIALLAHLALPVLSLVLPAWQLPLFPQRVAQSHPQGPPSSASLVNSSLHVGPRRPIVGAPGLSAGSPDRGELTARIAKALAWLRGGTAGAVLLVLWLAGTAAVLARLALGTVSVVRLKRGAERVYDGAWLSLAQQVATALRIRQPVTLLRGNRLGVPVTWGTIRPVVLLPDDADEWPVERRRLVLMHEMAHVKRGDALTQVLGQITLAVFWMNPLVWLAVRQTRLERERACDDYVLRGGMIASSYAAELLAMVRGMRTRTSPGYVTLALVRRSDFESRMLAILDPTLRRSALERRGVLVAVGLTALFVVPLAVLKPVEKQAATVERPFAAAAPIAPLTVLPPLVATASSGPEPARVLGKATPHRRAPAVMNERPEQLIASLGLDSAPSATCRQVTVQMKIEAPESRASLSFDEWCNITMQIVPERGSPRASGRRSGIVPPSWPVEDPDLIEETVTGTVIPLMARVGIRGNMDHSHQAMSIISPASFADVASRVALIAMILSGHPDTHEALTIRARLDVRGPTSS